MGRYVVRRALRALVVLWGVSTVVFLVVRLSGDPIALLVPPETPAAEVERIRHNLGLDAPIWIQYAVFVRDVASGNFGRSLRSNQPVTEIVLERVGPTLELGSLALALAVLVAVPIGILSALRPNSLCDHLAMAVALIGQSLPTFVVGIILILVFSVQLRLLPAGGRGEWQQLILPTLALAAYAMASIARITRSAMLEVIGREYIRTAHAKGLAEARVVLGHALKNAANPIVTVIALQCGVLLGGAVVIETVFSWPGMGRLAVQAIGQRDYPVVQGTVFMAAVGFVLVNAVVDLLYGLLDPRIRYA